MAALDELMIGWNPEKKAHTFPMKDGYANIIGIRLRTLTGKKFSVPGSKNGIFFPVNVRGDGKEKLFICEGPTDCAALLDMGLPAIGRASCGTGYKYIKEVIEHFNRQVVIFADKDPAKYAPDGRKFFPGYDGALKLARSIKPFVRSVCMIKPPKVKDVRKWYQAGATREAVMHLVKNARFL
jgi:DNA primase